MPGHDTTVAVGIVATCRHTARMRRAALLLCLVATSCVSLRAEAGAPPTTFPEPYYDIPMAVAVLTQPDSGGGGTTMRWAGPQVTYNISLPGYPAAYVTKARQVLRWGGGLVGLQMVEVRGPAQIEVVPKAGNGANVTADLSSSGALEHVTFELGCCRDRAVWEDGLQALGPLGDRADARSVFSQDHTAVGPSRFDAWVLRGLYAVPPGSSALLAAQALQLLAGKQDPQLGGA